jgi:hypothetical protein
MTIDEIAETLRRMGCPAEKCRAMASQLDRRSRMDADRKKGSYEAELQRLIGLMAQGWASGAKDRVL